MVIRSFGPFALRFFFRHPKKLSQLRQHWRDYSGRFGKIASLTGHDTSDVVEVLHELECEEPLFRELNGLAGMPMHPIVYYAVIRLVQPDVLVETGVCDGFSSRFILLALEKNRRGVLHSIDLPNQDVPVDAQAVSRQKDVLPTERETGWLVPSSLRDRWHLHLGDAKEVLPKLLQKLGPIDVFIHDSLHSYEHMMFEFQTAWPWIKPGGVLLSDDTDWNSAFEDFSRSVGISAMMFNYRVGGLRKSCASL